jgi:hypothetical protein
MLDLGLYAFYALLGIAVVAAIVFPILNAIKSPKALIKSLISLGAVLVLFGVAYALSSSEVSPKNASLGIDGTNSKLIGAGLIMFYISLGLAALALLYSEISKAVR